MNQEKFSPPHLRELLGVSGEYVGYCREERNFAAILYHLLLNPKYLASFLALIGQPAVEPRDVHIYFEYAHLRDLWTKVAYQEQKAVKAKNERYRAAIVAMLRMPAKLERQLSGVREFNAFFIGPRARAASDKHIQMPSRWSDTQFDRWFQSGQEHGDDEFAKRVCSLKWAFNAKPDLVLHLGKNKAICIEAKLESGAGSYKAKFDSHPDGCFSMGQLELQELILEQLLGYDTDFVMISKEKNKGNSAHRWRNHSWGEVFGELLSDHSPVTGESPMVAAFHNSRFIQQ